MLGISDLKQVIERLIGPQNSLSDNDMKQLIQNILAEADLDDDHALSFPEFEQLVIFLLIGNQVHHRNN